MSTGRIGNLATVKIFELKIGLKSLVNQYIFKILDAMESLESFTILNKGELLRIADSEDISSISLKTISFLGKFTFRSNSLRLILPNLEHLVCEGIFLEGTKSLFSASKTIKTMKIIINEKSYVSNYTFDSLEKITVLSSPENKEKATLSFKNIDAPKLKELNIELTSDEVQFEEFSVPSLENIKYKQKQKITELDYEIEGNSLESLLQYEKEGRRLCEEKGRIIALESLLKNLKREK